MSRNRAIAPATDRLPVERWLTGRARLLRRSLDRLAFRQPALWYYTPMALGFTRHLTRLATIYDCMDELSLFLGAPAELAERERELFARADLVFTGGQSLYEAKRRQ